MERPEPPILVMGDVHGQLGKLLGHLRNSGLIDHAYDWSGGKARLFFLGDYVNRGPSGLDVLYLIRHLQEGAAHEGGQVLALLGNHDACQLAARLFLNDSERGPSQMESWIANGGQREDVTGLDDELARWFSNLPALAIVDDTLLMHADSDFYLAYGESVDAINHEIGTVIGDRDPDAWSTLLTRFGGRHVFDETTPGGKDRARVVLGMLGADRLVHGHTPIDKVTGQRPEAVTQSFVYAKGMCVNADGGMYRGGPGFLVRLR